MIFILLSVFEQVEAALVVYSNRGWRGIPRSDCRVEQAGISEENHRSHYWRFSQMLLIERRSIESGWSTD